MASAAEQIEVALRAARVITRNINDVPALNRADINIEHVTQTLTHSIIHDANYVPRYTLYKPIPDSAAIIWLLLKLFGFNAIADAATAIVPGARAPNLQSQ